MKCKDLEIIKREESGIWKARNEKTSQNGYFVYISKRDKSGGTKRPSRQSFEKNLAQAREKKQAYLSELNKIVKEGPQLTFGEIVPLYFEHIDAKKSESSVIREKASINAHFLPAFEKRTLREITELDCERHLNAVTVNKKPQTFCHLLSHLNSIFKFARKKGYLTISPSEQIERPTIDRGDPLVLTEEQTHRLLNYLRIHYPIIYYHAALAYLTLARAGELRALTWAEVDTASNQILIKKTLDPKTGLKLTTKGKLSRKVWINSALQEILNELRPLTHTSDLDPILPHWREFAGGEQGKPLKMICGHLGIPKIRWHDLRATGITHLLLHGVPVSKVMLTAGHVRMSTTQIYLRLSGTEADHATECLKVK